MWEDAPGQRLDPAAARRRLEHEDAEQGDPEPERGQDEVLPAGLERAGAAAEADEERRGRGRRLDREPGGAEVPGERYGEQDCPEREERGPVDAVGAIGPEQRSASAGQELGRDERAREADDRRSRRRGALRRDRRRSSVRARGGRLGEGDDRERDGCRGGRDDSRDSDAARASARGTAATTTTPTWARRARQREPFPVVTEAPQRGGVAGAELGEDPLVEHACDEGDQQQVDGDADLDRERRRARQRRGPRARARSRRARSRAPGTASRGASHD